MQKLSVPRFGLAMGGSFLILNLICVISIVLFGPKPLASLVSIIFHGLDMSAIVSRQVGFWMAIGSLAIFFILGEILGTLIAAIYNWTMPKKS